MLPVYSVYVIFLQIMFRLVLRVFILYAVNTKRATETVCVYLISIICIFHIIKV